MLECWTACLSVSPSQRFFINLYVMLTLTLKECLFDGTINVTVKRPHSLSLSQPHSPTHANKQANDQSINDGDMTAPATSITARRIIGYVTIIIAVAGGWDLDGYDNNGRWVTTAFRTTTKTSFRFHPQQATTTTGSFRCRSKPAISTALYDLSSSSSSPSSSSSNTSPKQVNMIAIRANDRIGRKSTQDDDDDDCLAHLPSKHKARERTPPFPTTAYSNLKDIEEGLSFNYISFIDQSILKQYSQQTRLVEPRRYAIPDQFEKQNANVEPTIDDIAMPQSYYGPVAKQLAWNGLPARAVVGSASYLAFPYIIALLDASINSGGDVTVGMIELSKLIDSFLPGVAIVLGTYYSLTISILYDRLAKLTNAVNLECSQLALTLINLLHLFEDTDEEAAIEGSQCVADQVRVLVHDNRGRETMGVVYSDPYARLLRLLKDYSNTDSCTSLVNDAYLLSDLHVNVGKLFQLRTDRLTVESLALAPTHFDVMTFLSGMLLVGFALGTVATAPETGVPSEIARVLFAGLVVCYTIFYEMAFDLNRPFDGIYQLRRSGAAMHLLQIKQIVTTHPVLKGRVDFDVIEDDDDDDRVGECDGDCQQRKTRIWYN